MKKKYELTPRSLFLGMVIILDLFGIFWICHTRGAIDIGLEDTSLYFIDFFDHIFYIQAPQNVYDVDFNACFPPLAYMFYWVIAQMLPENSVVMNDTSSLSAYAILLFMIYHIILGILFYDSISKLLQSKGGGKKQQFVADNADQYIKCFCILCCTERKRCFHCMYFIAQGFGAEGT